MLCVCIIMWTVSAHTARPMRCTAFIWLERQHPVTIGDSRGNSNFNHESSHRAGTHTFCVRVKMCAHYVFKCLYNVCACTFLVSFFLLPLCSDHIMSYLLLASVRIVFVLESKSRMYVHSAAGEAMPMRSALEKIDLTRLTECMLCYL